MAILLKVKWVELSREDEPHQRIQHIGGDSRELRWKHSQSEAIDLIERDLFCYYVEDGLQLARLHVAQTAEGNKFLASGTDARQQQLLLNLPQFPLATPALR
jgi:hypothetical protein